MRFIALVVAAATLFAQPAYAAGYGEFIGNWRNENPSTNDITRLRIRLEGGGLSVRAWGQCHPVDCDWGVVSSVEYSYSPAANPAVAATDVIAIFNPGFAQKTLILTDRPGDRISYTIYTRYTDGSRRRPFVRSCARPGGGGEPRGATLEGSYLGERSRRLDVPEVCAEATEVTAGQRGGGADRDAVREAGAGGAPSPGFRMKALV